MSKIEFNRREKVKDLGSGKNTHDIKFNRLGQVTIFIITAIAIVGLAVVFFVFRSSFSTNGIPEIFTPLYESYTQCINDNLHNGLQILEANGGHIEPVEFLPPSGFAPFSNSLSFVGNSIPYWYSITGKNQLIENVPNINHMQIELADYVTEHITTCDLSEFTNKGFTFLLTPPKKVLVSIVEGSVKVSVDSTLSATFGEQSAVRQTHETSVTSALFGLYTSAQAIYSLERSTSFLEQYSIDVLRSYAPVDGVETQCSPKIWKTQEVIDELHSALNANLAAITPKGSRVHSDGKLAKYFEMDLSVPFPVQFTYLPKEFPSKIEVTPASQSLMIAEPVGTQEGLGIMGFCYVPYHFVYDVSFPVLVQIGDTTESFQFPIVIVIDNNLPISINQTDISDNETVQDICTFSSQDVLIHTYDTALNPISANVSYQCFDSTCTLGNTFVSDSESNLRTNLPSCVNGYLLAEATGYAPSKLLFSSNTETTAEIILEKTYPLHINLTLSGKQVRNSTSIIHFTKDDGTLSANALLPDTSTVYLTEGLYNISVFVYGQSNVVIPSSRKTECFTAAKTGLAGFFGGKKEQCVDVEYPAVNIDYALQGGGKTTSYLLESELSSGRVTIEASELAKPTSLEQLQYNFGVFDNLGVNLVFPSA